MQTGPLQCLNGVLQDVSTCSTLHDHMTSRDIQRHTAKRRPVPPSFQDAGEAPRLAAVPKKLEKWRMLHRGGGPWKWRQRKALPAVLICSTDETLSRQPWTVCKHYRVLRRAFGARCGQRDREARVLGRVHEYFYMLSDRNTDRNRAPASPMPNLTRIAPSPQGTTFRLACSRLLVSTSTLLSLRILVTTTIAGFWNVSSCFRHNAMWILTLRIVSLSVPLSSLNRAATTRRCALRARDSYPKIVLPLQQSREHL